MTKAEPKPKLPKVWVSFTQDQVFASRMMDHVPLGADSVVAQYAPVQKPRVCVWYQDGEGSFWVPSCAGLDGAWEFTNDGPVENECTYCMRCGGKIVTKGDKR